MKLKNICNTTETLCNILNSNTTCEEIASFEEEETNTIHHRKRSIDALMSNQSYKTQLSSRETTAASSINIHFALNRDRRY